VRASRPPGCGPGVLAANTPTTGIPIVLAFCMGACTASALTNEMMPSGLLILEEPTFGVDVGAKAEIYRLLQEALDRGLAVILVSSDFEEVAGISSRALVFDRGRVTAKLAPRELTVARLTALASGT
jgi:ABC-type glutathione transport system ATPase component